MIRRVAFFALFAAVIGCGAVVEGAEPQGPTPAAALEHRVPAPPAVGVRPRDVGVEMPAPIEMPSIVKARDGRLLMLGSGRVSFSRDGGKTWTGPESLPVAVKFAIRLASGKLGGPGADDCFFTSEDDGKTWNKSGKMSAGVVPASPYEAGTSAVLIQTRSGRLFMPVRFTEGAGHGGLYDTSGAHGTLHGKLRHIEGHAHMPEPDNTHVLYSDDEGKTWSRSEGGIMIWHQQGYGGMWPCDEPTIVEAQNGDLLLFLRTTLGRVYTARSSPVDYVNREGKRVQYAVGHRFDHPQPTPLAGSYSPCVVRRIPKTGDLLLVWNQVSGDEIRGGYRRGRLSSAVSKDDGRTWQHFRTIDRVVLPPAGRVAPDPEPRMARGLDYVGVLPDDYGAVDYPTVEIVDDTVFVFWYRQVVQPRPGDVTGRRMWAVPRSWFYEDEPPLAPGPGLVLKIPAGDGKAWNAVRVPAQFFDGRFYCRLDDLAVYLKSPVGRTGYNIYAPLDQVITCLGWTPEYDASCLKRATDPHLIVWCTHPHDSSAPKRGE
jgi:hypothetical protein